MADQPLVVDWLKSSDFVDHAITAAQQAQQAQQRCFEGVYELYKPLLQNATGPKLRDFITAVPREDRAQCHNEWPNFKDRVVEGSELFKEAMSKLLEQGPVHTAQEGGSEVSFRFQGQSNDAVLIWRVKNYFDQKEFKTEISKEDPTVLKIRW